MRKICLAGPHLLLEKFWNSRSIVVLYCWSRIYGTWHVSHHTGCAPGLITPLWIIQHRPINHGAVYKTQRLWWHDISGRWTGPGSHQQYLDELVQERRNSIANTLELCTLYRTNPLSSVLIEIWWHQGPFSYTVYELTIEMWFFHPFIFIYMI